MDAGDATTRWAIISHTWVTSEGGVLTLGDARVEAFASSPGHARRLVRKLNVAGSGRHWSVVPFDASEGDADGDEPGGDP
jgi:hypothetical protein